MRGSHRGFALADVVLSIVVMLLLLIPSARILNRAYEMIARAEHFNRLTAVMESATEKVRTKQWRTGSYSEEDFEIVLSLADSSDPRIEVVHITIKDREGTAVEIEMFRRVSE